MEFRNTDHRYVVSDSSDELNNIYNHFMPERVSETKEETFWLKKSGSDRYLSSTITT
jgi:hypothetical protein